MKVGVYAPYTNKGIRQRRLTSKIFKLIEENELDIFLGAEYLFMPQNKFHKKKKRDKLIHKFMKKSDGLDTLIVPGTMAWYDDTHFYNTSFAFSDGKLLSSYDKFLDFDTIDKAVLKKCHKRRKVNSNPIRQDFGIFYWNDLICGVETSNDGTEHLLEEFLENNSGPLLDLYLLSSCGLTVQPGYCRHVIDGGNWIGADGLRTRARAYKKDDLSLKGYNDVYAIESRFNPDTPFFDSELNLSRRDFAFQIFEI